VFSRTSTPCHDIAQDRAASAVAEATYPPPAGVTPMYGRLKQVPNGWAAGTRHRLPAWNKYCEIVAACCQAVGVAPKFFMDVPPYLVSLGIWERAAIEAQKAADKADATRKRSNASRRWADPP
jgi:hypothetical protein